MKLFFDHNLPPRAAELLEDFYRYDHPDLECTYLTKKFQVTPNDPLDDPVWLSTLSSEGGWIVFTRDRARSSKILPLPEICLNLKITHVLVSDSLGRLSDLKQAIVECWRCLETLSRKPPGTRARLQYRMHKKHERVPIIRLIERDVVIKERKIQSSQSAREIPRSRKKIARKDSSDPSQMPLEFKIS
jgi:hypothetical protein